VRVVPQVHDPGIIESVDQVESILSRPWLADYYQLQFGKRLLE
jgi:hypothetical protein